MKPSLLWLAFSGVILLSGNIYALPATIEGTVTAEQGQALRNTQVRVQGREGSWSDALVQTDSRGRYTVSGLSSGTFKVTLIVDGEVRASIANVTAEAGQIEILNFELNKAAAAKPVAKGKHYVWVPARGNQSSGSWVELNDDSHKVPVGKKERSDSKANAILRQIQANGCQARQM